MPGSPEKFRNLLTDAIKTIQTYDQTKKTIEAIHDELGTAIGRPGSTIEYWRRGNIPHHFEDVDALAREIIRRAGSKLSSQWLKQFLTSADYPYIDFLCSELLPQSKPQELQQKTNLLPPKHYGKLVGRASIIDEVLNILSSTTDFKAVGIDGMGGIGKSAIAIEIGHACMLNGIFDNIIWSSAELGTIYKPLVFETLIEEIGIQLGALDIAKVSLSEKIFRVQTLLQQRPSLIILDNMETAKEGQEQILRKLQPLIGSSKILLTSRNRLKGNIYPINLGGLDTIAAESFILEECRKKNINRIKSATKEDLLQVTTVTGGSPLALKVVVGQLHSQELPVILKHLSRVIPLSTNPDEDEYLSFYREIFFPSWNLLSENGKRLLLAMTVFPTESGGNISSIRATSKMSDVILTQSIEELWQLSFVEISESGALSEFRYYLHALTKHFVRSDIARLPD